MSEVFSTKKEVLFHAWLSSEEHSAFTEAGAEIENVIGGKFTAWDGYIEGKTLEIEPSNRILQSWRTTAFPENSRDSTLEIIFEEEGSGTKVTLKHSNIPAGDGEEYKQGWIDFYFIPMKKYFEK